MVVVVSYDVATTTEGGKTRLRRVAKECVNFGQRVQNSVFECNLDQTQFEVLKSRLLKIIDDKVDSLRFYYLGNSWKSKVEHHGNKQIIALDEPIVL